MPGKVTVGCKLPNGLHLRLPGVQGVTLKGALSSSIVGGHGITENVDKDFFDRWMEIHKDYKPVKSGLIFAHKQAASTKAEAKEKVDVPTGLEGLDPDKPAPGIKPEKYEGMVEKKK